MSKKSKKVVKEVVADAGLQSVIYDNRESNAVMMSGIEFIETDGLEAFEYFPVDRIALVDHKVVFNRAGMDFMLESQVADWAKENAVVHKVTETKKNKGIRIDRRNRIGLARAMWLEGATSKEIIEAQRQFYLNHTDEAFMIRAKKTYVDMRKEMIVDKEFVAQREAAIAG